MLVTVTVDNDEEPELELLPLEVDMAEVDELLDVTAFLPPGTFKT